MPNRTDTVGHTKAFDFNEGPGSTNFDPLIYTGLLDQIIYGYRFVFEVEA